MTALPVLLVVGLVALGLPQLNHRQRQRPWYGWLSNGLAPLILGMTVGIAAAPQVGQELREVAAALAGVALAAAGILLGSQLRLAYLLRAGGHFLRHHSTAVAYHGAVVAASTAVAAWVMSAGWGWLAMGLFGAWSVMTSQRPPAVAGRYDMGHRRILYGHVAPAGWWNLLALAAFTLVVALSEPGQSHAGVSGTWRLPLAAGVAVLIGLLLAWLSVQARNREEGQLVVLVALGLAAGLAALLAVPALLIGLVVGAMCANISLSHAPWLEQSMERHEQPMVVAAGLFAGLSLTQLSLSPTIHGAYVVVAVVLIARWLVRLWWSPCQPDLASQAERCRQGPGASAVLAIATLTLAQPHSPWLLPLLAATVIATLVHDCWPSRK